MIWHLIPNPMNSCAICPSVSILCHVPLSMVHKDSRELVSACLPNRSASLRESAQCPYVGVKGVSNRDAEFIEETLSISITNGL
jgi:hypothetical protein